MTTVRNSSGRLNDSDPLSKPAFTPEKPVLYVSEFTDCAIVCDPHHDLLLRLNSTAIAMWKLLAGGHGKDEVIQAITKKYSVSQTQVEQDLHSLSDRLTELGLSLGAGWLLTNPDNTETQQRQDEPSRFGRASVTATLSHPLDVLVAFCGLIMFDIILSVASIEKLLSVIRKQAAREQSARPASEIALEVCSAVERACVWYPKRALCLQRAAVTTYLLRKKGVRARLVIGVHSMPLLAHAWVEIAGTVVNDFAQLRSFYQVVTTC